MCAALRGAPSLRSGTVSVTLRDVTLRESADKSRTNGLGWHLSTSTAPPLTRTFAPDQPCRRGDLNPHAPKGTSPSS